MKKKSVLSSNLDWVKYNEETRKLIIGFKDGSEYEYSNVPLNIYEGLLSAPSKGKYFHKFIKNQYFTWKRR
ncbi:MAG: KTSC domain-containing protein [Candidatus Heimdallarchaeaceae archaeon]